MYGKCGEGAYTAWHVHPQFLVIAFAPYSHVAFFFGNISWNSITHYRFGFRTQLKLSYSQDLLAYTISLQVVLLRVC